MRIKTKTKNKKKRKITVDKAREFEVELTKTNQGKCFHSLPSPAPPAHASGLVVRECVCCPFLPVPSLFVFIGASCLCCQVVFPSFFPSYFLLAM